MNIFAPTKLELLSESPEGNDAEHYAYRRECDSAYWTAIYYAYRNRKNSLNSGMVAWDTFVKEVESVFPTQ